MANPPARQAAMIHDRTLRCCGIPQRSSNPTTDSFPARLGCLHAAHWHFVINDDCFKLCDGLREIFMQDDIGTEA